MMLQTDAGSEEETPQDLLDRLLTEQRLGVLATAGEGRPYTSLLAFAARDNLSGIFFATARGTRKYANISANPEVAFLVDDARRAGRDFEQVSAVTAEGTVVELEGERRKQAQEVLLSRHPQLEEFVSSADCALMELLVSSYHLVGRFGTEHQIEVELDGERTGG